MLTVQVLDRGYVAQCGSHSELIESGGLYAAMWARQKDIGSSHVDLEALLNSASAAQAASAAQHVGATQGDGLQHDITAAPGPSHTEEPGDAGSASAGISAFHQQSADALTDITDLEPATSGQLALQRSIPAAAGPEGPDMYQHLGGTGPGPQAGSRAVDSSSDAGATGGDTATTSTAHLAATTSGGGSGSTAQRPLAGRHSHGLSRFASHNVRSQGHGHMAGLDLGEDGMSGECSTTSTRHPTPTRHRAANRRFDEEDSEYGGDDGPQEGATSPDKPGSEEHA